ncbi:UDP-3-O-(3-hydroxymyristoyl)glucosamine N-acyltransferase [Pontibacter sp. G13]|uniref:UDP-3-O-(3-hydroxymyristoyl)glucosamine N-acyltransferase n=1 Tax=Pontibacter sp. G13 TaxID=3074898 RepID=UPI00288A9A94|nr:UDP-3-O-(3-hydroxymyristoyl)glucosamine N-acyltransferase [Pontibacter sp. G13]WNJ18841.1 UDP-3-O-(3-hydroxymyristoyl)glucosamine N-acyltransferase [Pontibacter sp. G13]
MKFQIGQIAELLQAEVEGDSTLEIDKVSKIEEGEAGSICFLANPKYTPHLYTTRASAVIVAKDLVLTDSVSATLLRVENPYLAFTSLLEQVNQAPSPKQGIESQAFVSPEATIGEGVYIGAFAYVSPKAKIGDNAQIFPGAFVGEGVQIGAHTVVYPQATIYHYCKVGNHCIIHAGARIGSDGFGFAPQADGSFKKIPQTGNVVLEDHVEIGSNTCIDRATMGSTVIKQGAKVDNLVQIAHNVELGEASAVAAQTGISGSTKIGKYCLFGGQVGIVGHLEIADKTRIDAQSGVNKSIKESGKSFRGSPIQPYRQQLKSELMFRKLEEMYKRLDYLEQEIAKRG